MVNHLLPADTPPGRHPLPTDTPPGQIPLLGRYPSWADTPLGRHPSGRRPPQSKLPFLPDTPLTPSRWPLQRTVRILLECILVYLKFLRRLSVLIKLCSLCGVIQYKFQHIIIKNYMLVSSKFEYQIGQTHR